MKSLIKISCLVLSAMMLSSCYEDYIKDYNYSATYFAAQKPLRTVISDRDMTIDVGVAIAGKREVDPNDWAKFVIDGTLLEGTGLVMLPEEYYTISDPEMMRISDKSLPIADVTISFNDAFYKDAHSTQLYYAIPFRIVESSSDKILEGKETSIVAIKYVSTYQGTYYVRGKRQELDESGEVVATRNYYNPDITNNITRTVSTITTNDLSRRGFADFVTDDPLDRFKITFFKDGRVRVYSEEGAHPIVEGSGSGEYETISGRLVLHLKYKFEKDGKTYYVEEDLYRRRDPYDDLRFETWE